MKKQQLKGVTDSVIFKRFSNNVNFVYFKLQKGRFVSILGVSVCKLFLRALSKNYVKKEKKIVHAW